MATKIISVSLDEHFSAFAERQVASGAFASPQDVVQAGLQLLRFDKEARERLRHAIQEGLDSEDVGPLDFEAYLRGKDGLDDAHSCAA